MHADRSPWRPDDDDNGGIVLSTVLLNWNRADLLARTVESYAATVTVPHELIVVDNGSTDDSPRSIEALCGGKPHYQAMLLPENLGGEALNVAIERCRGRYVHVSENDVRYLPGWDQLLLAKLRTFPELGQISPFRAGGTTTPGWTRDGLTIFPTEGNVTTTCVTPREVYARGASWTSHGARSIRVPADSLFSRRVKAMGYVVAWNDTDVAHNLGWRLDEYVQRLPYYLATAAVKPGGLAGFDRDLQRRGYRLVQDETGAWSIRPL